ncbi:MAG: hypothetical protein WBG48_06840, partial [Pricia sp.]
SDAVLVSSGKDGYLVSYKKSDLSVQKEAPFADLRSIALDFGDFAILDGSTGVSFLDSEFNIINSISIDSDFGDFAKRTIAITDQEVIVSEGSKGAGIYSKAGNFKKYLPILINPEGTAQSDIVTNAVAVNENAVFMANGGAGLSISEDQGNNTDMVGVLDLNGSINFVASEGDYAFAASGKAGLQIVKLNRPNPSLEARCSELLEYNGNANLSVAQGDTEEYKGSKRFNKITVDGSLLLCGTWSVNNGMTVNPDGLFEMNGNIFIGRNNKRKNVTVSKNATLRIEGTLTIYGDLVLEDGATLQFIGDNSVANIFGQVVKSDSAEVKGIFDDLRNQF